MEWNYEEGRIFSIDEKGELMAEVTYVYQSKEIVNINHVYVNPILRGQGVADLAMKTVTAHLREKGLKAIATCTYANPWLKKNRELYSDIIAEDFDS